MEQQTLTLRMALIAIWQRKLMIALLTALIAGAASVVIYTLPRLYQVESSLLLIYKEEYNSLSPTGRYDGGIRVNLAEAIGSEMQILNSRTIKAEVVDQLTPEGMFPSPPPTPSLAERVWTAVGAPSLDLAALRNRAGEWLAQIGIDVASAAPTTAAGPAGAARPDASPTEKAIERLTEGINIRRVEGSNIVMIRYTHPNPEIAATTLNTLVDTFRKRREEYFAKVDYAPLQRQLEAAEARLRDIDGRMDRVIRASSNTVGLTEQVRVLTQSRIAIAQQLGDTRRLSTPEWRADLRDQLNKIDGQLAAAARSDQELQRLHFEHENAQKSYDHYRSMLESATTAETLRQAQAPTIRVVDRAFPPPKPTGLGPNTMAALALVLGTMLSMLLAMGLGPKQRVLTAPPTIREIERQLKVPVLAVIEYGGGGAPRQLQHRPL
ncbi:hypothetical protein [Azospirillum sp. TSO35-2]|uniref:hypothetical protein n=1 Tax=Azospirillum sp. TSO35-2 TaxID=716796 RepID=UPI000D61CF36|nr:hypothetical protein [Azospirillum sp. TSO35-2]PWC35993.1 hypothetical protein TSO352_12465 [Azospirillum sp. TSO35-2]